MRRYYDDFNEDYERGYEAGRRAYLTEGAGQEVADFRESSYKGLSYEKGMEKLYKNVEFLMEELRDNGSDDEMMAFSDLDDIFADLVPLTLAKVRGVIRKHYLKSKPYLKM